METNGFLGLIVNGVAHRLDVPPGKRLTRVLREDLGLTGTKVGCDAGDCGACTVLLDDRQVCACLVPVGQAEGRSVRTVEGLADGARLNRLQEAFWKHGAAQCGICTPGMLMAGMELLERTARPTRDQAMDALGGVLCRCTGYQKIVEAMLDAAGNGPAPPVDTLPDGGMGARVARLDGRAKLDGTERYGADHWPADCLHLRVVRSPYAHATFEIGDLAPVHARFPGLHRILTAKDIPGVNGFGIYPDIKDQPVLAPGRVLYRGDAVLALLGDRETIDGLTDEDLPITWTEKPAVLDIDTALDPASPPLHDRLTEHNVLIRGRVRAGEAEEALGICAAAADTRFDTPFVEHGYIEPEAGYAVRVGDRVHVYACTQAPYMDLDEVANVLGFDKGRVRIVPTACGGGFGGKLDVSLQPILAVAAWLTDRPVRYVYDRPESMRASTKRHPARIDARLGADADGRLKALRLHADFDTGAYASWGPTVAGRVPVHATGPYRVENVLATSAAIHTNQCPSGAFRGFGVPQSALATEGLMDDLAARLGIDPLEFRLRNALRPGDRTATGQVLERSVGMAACLEAVAPRWKDWRADAQAANAAARVAGSPMRRGVGVGCMWYGCGNTSMSNPSHMRVTVDAAGRVTLYNGAVDIGQGTYTIMPQVCAETLGVPVSTLAQVTGDTDATLDAGKTSASRQTFVSGRAVKEASLALLAEIRRRANAGPAAVIRFEEGAILAVEDGVEKRIDLSGLPVGADGAVLEGIASFDPPTTPLDADGQGTPYATYGFAAQIAEVVVDIDLGTVKPLRILAAHDVGRAVNPTMVEGQIHGGVAQGLGLALMEEYLPGRTENLHDYLIPTFGDMPEIECLLIEDEEPEGPYGAKGIGEPALVPTAPAILGAIRHATGAVVRRVPALPHRVLTAIREADAEAASR
ncbi:molybdopterin-dependent oxidoreductase [Marivibrio halodurans]|uniref:Molybdopterin-dependent oxidoreductase n=2 Tax=Marivibrio halodurans TaxID=2039722 RepID=A0A8J7S408_9PROT|nr:molybdopterin-dependent oxidoreductase [Marivibrio halodurans]